MGRRQRFLEFESRPGLVGRWRLDGLPSEREFLEEIERFIREEEEEAEEEVEEEEGVEDGEHWQS
ncbi:Hypothetical protein D9617_1g086510 [Elsinoe fawcettii]|nr:Hypothetical protein D9617_1g086510 [Elsinoe fawcettii]